MDDLFVRHTYLTAIIGMVVQASFGIDIRALAAANPADLVYGREFRNKTGLQGVVESDFFAWFAEVGGESLLATMARRVARFDWQHGSAPNDIAALLYETVIPPDERRTLGEYYTPQWLARAMTRELVTDPLNRTVLDPACGSGTFIAEAIANFIEAAEESEMHPSEIFGRLRDSVIGIDIHPVAVHLARAAYVLAARSAITEDLHTSITVPIYMGRRAPAPLPLRRPLRRARNHHSGQRRRKHRACLPRKPHRATGDLRRPDGRCRRVH